MTTTQETLEAIVQRTATLAKIPAAQRLAYAKSEIKIAKDKTASGKIRFAYTDFGSVMRVVNPILANWGLGLDIVSEGLLPEDITYYRVEAIIYDALATYSTREERLNSALATGCAYSRIPNGADTQTLGKMSSYARKYAVGGIFAIGGEEDPDESGDTAHPDPNAYQQQKPVQQKPRYTQGAAALAAFVKTLTHDQVAELQRDYLPAFGVGADWRTTLPLDKAEEIISEFSKAVTDDDMPEALMTDSEE